MKQLDAQYYADQINLFTAFCARAVKGELIVNLPDRKKRTRNEDEADHLYRQASRWTCQEAARMTTNK